MSVRDGMKRTVSEHVKLGWRTGERGMGQEEEEK